MDEDHEMERFGMDNDYDDGQWIDGEFYYWRRREKRAQTKDDVLYGVFASGDSDSDYDDSSKRKRRKNRDLHGKADLSKPVNFVSTGMVMPNREIDENSKTENEDDESADVDEDRPGLGVGAGVGLGFKKRDDGFDDNGEEKDGFLPTAFGRKIKEGAERRREQSKLEKKAQQGKRGSYESGNVGGFEKYTKGIGMKLLEKIGYEGGDLGKNQQGIVTPIEAKLQIPAKAPVASLEPEEKKPSPDVPGQEKLWSKQVKKATSKNKAKYITSEELLAKKGTRHAWTSQVRVLANLENLNVEEKARESDVPMPKLRHDVRSIVDLAELDIQTPEETTNVEIINTLGRIEEQKSMGTLTLDSLAKSFGDMQRRFPDDYKLCNLPCIACSFALPLFIRVFQRWDSLWNPFLTWVGSWFTVEILQGEECLSWKENLFLSIKIAIDSINTWEARNPEPMLRFLEDFVISLLACGLKFKFVSFFSSEGQLEFIYFYFFHIN
ncbi:hypothetical protein ACJRO7_026858 [Eucalyptus globulus]|uniref:G-patch domain-containing protein n=1 Tax=Eucalyptus globulus TaxID=34317 RepID=A0ABD3JQ91_EUCGL